LLCHNGADFASIEDAVTDSSIDTKKEYVMEEDLDPAAPGKHGKTKKTKALLSDSETDDQVVDSSHSDTSYLPSKARRQHVKRAKRADHVNIQAKAKQVGSDIDFEDSETSSKATGPRKSRRQQIKASTTHNEHSDLSRDERDNGEKHARTKGEALRSHRRNRATRSHKPIQDVSDSYESSPEGESTDDSSRSANKESPPRTAHSTSYNKAKRKRSARSSGRTESPDNANAREERGRNLSRAAVKPGPSYAKAQNGRRIKMAKTNVSTKSPVRDLVSKVNDGLSLKDNAMPKTGYVPNSKGEKGDPSMNGVEDLKNANEPHDSGVD
jgi:hypothetical protein